MQPHLDDAGFEIFTCKWVSELVKQAIIEKIPELSMTFEYRLGLLKRGIFKLAGQIYEHYVLRILKDRGRKAAASPLEVSKYDSSKKTFLLIQKGVHIS